MFLLLHFCLPSEFSSLSGIAFTFTICWNFCQQRGFFAKKNTGRIPAGRFSILNFNIRIFFRFFLRQTKQQNYRSQRCKKQKSKSDIITYYSRYCRGNYFFWNAFPYPYFFFIPCFNFVYGLLNAFLVFIAVIVISIFDIQLPYLVAVNN